ncbi:hypothetical protein AAFC00_000167 [Neodothiora populina]|uniref:non-specific serine/threonine protein kinase n=1 Tax=Neodothiora populina TaxID=2781224 RepID=A0ABR3P1Z8_9PEZI
MNSDSLDPFSAVGTKSKQVQDAKDMMQMITERASRTGTAVPDYTFLELIGKGSFGRVYKCERNDTREVVAVKIIDVDDLDYRLDNTQKDEAIADFTKEVSTLKHLKDSRAKNINYIQEAFDLHSQLWIVSDYCPGGSVHTLMKAVPSGAGLEEHFIIPIARELAVALKYVHEAGVIHRDVKCGNILISEQGDVQLCDFGVAGVMEGQTSKRSTIIGTPFWMPPEMHSMEPDSQEGYGTEVDCWAFGCTVYEMATGMPPNHKFHPSMLRTVLKAAPRLGDGDFSQDLRDFVAFCLKENPQERPTARQILEHHYIADTYEQYPTNSLRQMIDRYVQWEQKGGQRASLFNPYGAAAPQLSEESEGDFDDWNFSTTESFNKDFAHRYSQLGVDTADFALPEAGNDKGVPAVESRGYKPFEEVQEDIKAKRGEKSMQRLFDPDASPYDYNEPVEDDEQPLSDLPLRNLPSNGAANRETLIDLDMGGSELDLQPAFNFDFGDVPTLKAARPPRASLLADDDDNEDYDFTIDAQNGKRATREWKMPWSADPEPEPMPEPLANENANRKTLDWQMPWGGETSLTEKPQNRRTQDWSFPLSEIATENPSRRTQDWTFATAEVSEAAVDAGNEFTFPPAQSEDDINPGFRPMLTRTATEPIGQFKDFLHPPAQITLTSENDTRSVRDSTPMIDLDMASGPNFDVNFDLDDDNTMTMHRNDHGASPAVSLAGSTETRRNPFFLADVDRVMEEENKRSSHRQSRSEPQLLAAPSILGDRPIHSRGPSTESIVRLSRDRGFSLSSTASSDVVDSNWGRDYNRRLTEHTREQLMNDLHDSAIAARPMMGLHSRMNSFDDTDVDSVGPTGVHMPEQDDADYPMAGMRPLRSVSALGHNMDDGAHGDLDMRSGRARAGTGGTTTTMATSNGYDSDSYYQPRRSMRMPIFPRVLAPDPEALGEMADQDLVDQELDRLLDDLQNGLGAAAEAFNRRERELSGADEPEDMNQHFRGFGSEGDGE